MHRGFLFLDILNERDHLEDLGVYGNCAEDSGFWICHTVSTGSRRHFGRCSTFVGVEYLSKRRRLYQSTWRKKKQKTGIFNLNVNSCFGGESNLKPP